jgi:hypothetical protein
MDVAFFDPHDLSRGNDDRVTERLAQRQVSIDIPTPTLDNRGRPKANDLPGRTFDSGSAPTALRTVEVGRGAIMHSHSTVAAAATREPASSRDKVTTSATRTVVLTFGLLAGLAGVEHGVGEILQGSVRPEGLAIESWPDSNAFEILGGEPALTVIPNLLMAGIATVIVAVAVVVWSFRFVNRRHGGLVLILLSALLLLVGGGFGPPLIGVIVGFGATRIDATPRRRPGRFARTLGRVWPWILGAAVLGYLSLLPGTILLDQLLGVNNPVLVPTLSAFSFAGLILALGAARAEDRTGAGYRA